MNTFTPNQAMPLCTAAGIYDDLELYSNQLVIRPRALFTQLCAYTEVLDLSDIESVKNYPKRSATSAWMQMKIMCHKHKPVEISYSLAERSKMRELNNRLDALRVASYH